MTKRQREYDAKWPRDPPDMLRVDMNYYNENASSVVEIQRYWRGNTVRKQTIVLLQRISNLQRALHSCYLARRFRAHYAAAVEQYKAEKEK